MNSLAKRCLLFMLIACSCKFSFAQKIDSIYFNLYTDSLKKGFYNYISVDGKDARGQWHPLDSTKILFSTNAGFFKGNDVFIDSSYTGDCIKVKAVLKENPSVWKETVVYIRKRPFTEPLKSSDEILNEMKENRKKK